MSGASAGKHGPVFSAVVERHYRRTRTLSASDYLALLDTHSEYRILPDAVRSRLFDALAGLLPDRVDVTVDTILCMGRATPE